MPGPDDYWRDDGANDPYTDSDTGVLRNRLDLTTQAALENAETTLFQANYPQACAYIAARRKLDLPAWQGIHEICFGDIYDWAGQLRTIRISKGEVVFAYPEYIEQEGGRLLEHLNTAINNSMLNLETAAVLFAETNMIHPFREGNGRTHRILFEEALARVGYCIDYSRITQPELINALQNAALRVDYTDITALFECICTQR